MRDCRLLPAVAWLALACAIGQSARAGDGQRPLGPAVASTAAVGPVAAVVVPMVEPATPPRPLFLPRPVDEVLHWLPENTETVAVAQSFTIGSVLDWYAGKGCTSGQAARCFLAALSLDGLGRLGYGPREVAEARLLRMIGGLHVVLGLYGGRNYDPADCQRREECGILIFDSSLTSKSKEFLEALHGVGRLGMILRHEVFVCTVDNGLPPGPGLQPKSEPLLVMVPRPNVLLWSNNEAYLEELLRRMGCSPLGRALSDELPEWKFVDPHSGAFLVRHIPQRSPQPALTGLAMSGQCGRADALQVCYLLAPGSQAKIPGGPAVVIRNKQSAQTTIDLRRPSGGAAELGWLQSFARSVGLRLFLPTSAGLSDTGPVQF